MYKNTLYYFGINILKRHLEKNIVISKPASLNNFLKTKCEFEASILTTLTFLKSTVTWYRWGLQLLQYGVDLRSRPSHYKWVWVIRQRFKWIYLL